MSALILAAHGSRHDPAVNQLVWRHVQRIEQMGLFDQVSAAFHQGDPSFARVLDDIQSDHVTVVPLLTSKGYYSEVVLPRQLAKNRRYGEVVLRQTDPLGTHPAVARLIGERVRHLMDAFDLQRQDTGLAIVGHGTARHPGSRLTTEALAASLDAADLAAGVVAVYLDEAPIVEEVYERLSTTKILVLPFLISSGYHATRDIPERLGLEVADSQPPLAGQVHGRRVICDGAIGSQPWIADLVVD